MYHVCEKIDTHLEINQSTYYMFLSRFGADVMDIVASWTRNLCANISEGRMEHLDDDINGESKSSEQINNDLSIWSVLDIGTGNGLLLQGLEKQGYCLHLIYASLLIVNKLYPKFWMIDFYSQK